MYSVVPSPIEKHMILVSPYINNNYLPVLLQKLVENHITIVDIQKINFEKLQYEGG